jgi:RES domain-containing protein
LKSAFVEHAFDGEGARLYGGRWNSPGTAMVYCSATASLAVLEVFANLQRSDLAEHYVLITCTFDDVLVEHVDATDLDRDWRRSPPPAQLREIGDQWLAAGRTPVLAVPSAIIEHERNFLLNPNHRAFRKVQYGRPKAFAFDLRLLDRK